jgi:dTDP-4-amino-4,6-dideoxygalactose transaminase
MKVPYLDLAAHHAPLRRAISQAIEEVIDSGNFAGGPFVAQFEADFARYCEVEHCVGVGNGTDALWLALVALGIGPGDEVITVPMTFIATVEAISRAGATPVFVDIDPQTYTLNPKDLERVVTARTKAILPVHLFGQMADMGPILAFANERGIHVIEDAAQAHGADHHGQRAGSLGVAGCFSFYPGKNLGALGDAGAVVTRDAALAERMRVLRDHGQSQRYHHSVVGWNCRMDGIQAAVLRLKLRELDANNERRKAHAQAYSAALASVPNVGLPHSAGRGQHVHHIYAIRVPDRPEFMDHLARSGVATGIHYPIPVHLQAAYTDLGLPAGSFPISEKCAEEFVSLPMFPELTSAQIHTVVLAVEAAMSAELAA